MNKSIKQSNKKGSALLLTMFILVSMLIIAMSGAYILSAGIYAGKIQSESIKAYFTAEAGAERLLWELRHNGYVYPEDPSSIVEIFSGNLNTTGSSYKVYFTAWPPLIFNSIGEYKNTKRSVEVRM